MTTNPLRKDPLLNVPFSPLHKSFVSSFQLIFPLRAFFGASSDGASIPEAGVVVASTGWEKSSRRLKMS